MEGVPVEILALVLVLNAASESRRLKASHVYSLFASTWADACHSLLLPEV